MRSSKVKCLTALVAMLVLACGLARGADRENFSVTKLRIGDPCVLITATAAQINQLATGDITTATLISNAVMKVYGSNVVIVTGGTFTAPDDVIAVGLIADGVLGAGVIAQTVSNDTGQVYGSNLTVVAGGTVTFPADSVGADDIADGALGSGVIAQSISNATGLLEYDYAQVTLNAAGVYTQSFNVTFAAAPKVVLSYGEDPGATTNFALYYTGATESNAVFNGVASKKVDYFAIGTK